MLNCILSPSTMTNMARGDFLRARVIFLASQGHFLKYFVIFYILKDRPKLQCYYISEQEYIKGRKGLGFLIATDLPHFALV